MTTEKDSKILQYEAFVNERLKVDLHSILSQRDKLYEEIAEFLSLKNSIKAIEESGLKPGEPLKTKCDIGCNFYVQASVPDPSKIFVEIGLGFFAELTLVEAIGFIDKKVKILEENVKVLTEDSCKVKATIKLVLQGLRELQAIIPIEDQKKSRRQDLFM